MATAHNSNEGTGMSGKKRNGITSTYIDSLKNDSCTANLHTRLAVSLLPTLL
jgi:hypothetical protein